MNLTLDILEQKFKFVIFEHCKIFYFFKISKNQKIKKTNKKIKIIIKKDYY